MAVVVAMHACSAWPTSVDVTIFQCFLDGYTAEETVEQLMAHDVGDPTSSTASPACLCTKKGRRGTVTTNSDDTALPPRNTVPDMEAAFPSEDARVSLAEADEEEACMVEILAVAPSTKSSPTTASTSHMRESKRVGKGTHSYHRTRSWKCETSTNADHSNGSHTADCPNKINFFLSPNYQRFQHQLQRCNEATATANSSAPTASPSPSAPSPGGGLLREEVVEQYHFFGYLKQRDLLSAPYSFLANPCFPMSVRDRLQLVNMYYSVDPAVQRLYFGATSSFLETCNVRGSEFMTSWWSRWGPLTQKAELPTRDYQEGLAHLRPASLRRQWENTRLVCSSITGMYRGKGGLAIKKNVPVTMAVQQCFGLQDKLLLDYATQVFGYEHRLTGKLFSRLHSFDDYTAVCNLIAASWCDDTKLFLRDTFVRGCERFVKLIDESRVLSELHSLLFGEIMRPRWQVQLDEMQRAIAPTADKNATSSGAQSVPGGAPALPMSACTATSIQSGSNHQQQHQHHQCQSGNSLNASATNREINHCVVPPTFGAAGPHLAHHCGHSSTLVASFASSPRLVHAVPSAHSPSMSPNVSLPNSTSNAPSPLCANRIFSRRFMQEFPNLLKYLLRIAIHISADGNISTALEIFYSRVFTYMESLSLRSAHAVMSYMLHAGSNSAVVGPQSPGAGAAPTSVAMGREDGRQYFGSLDGTLSHDSGHTPLPTATLYGSIGFHSDSESIGVRRSSSLYEAANIGGGRSQLNASSSISVPSSGVLLEEVEFNDVRFAEGGGEMTGPLQQSASEHFPFGSGVINASMVVNASMVAPMGVRALLPNTMVCSSPLSRVPGGGGLSPLAAAAASASGTLNGESNGVTSPRNTSFAFPRRATPATMSTIATGAQASPSSVPSSLTARATMSDRALKAVDKHFLRELCCLFNLLPRMWQQLTMLSEDDHAETDIALESFVLCLKGVTQLLMAADDFT